MAEEHSGGEDGSDLPAGLTHSQLQQLYRWVDKIPLSRPKRNIARDFSDGVLMSEVVAHFYPKMVELHNYSKSSALQQKQYNWQTLNTKVFRKMGFTISPEDVVAVVECHRGAIERTLLLVKEKLQVYAEAQKARASAPPPPAAAAAPAPSHSSNRSPGGDSHASTGTAAASRPASKPSSAAAKRSRSQSVKGTSSTKGPTATSNGSTASRRETKQSRQERPPVAASRRGAAATAERAPSPSTLTTPDHHHPPAHYRQQQGQRQEEEESRPEQRYDGPSPAEVAAKDQRIADLEETVAILQEKVQKMEQLLRLKNTKIDTLTQKLSQLSTGGYGGGGGAHYGGGGAGGMY